MKIFAVRLLIVYAVCAVLFLWLYLIYFHIEHFFTLIPFVGIIIGELIYGYIAEKRTHFILLLGADIFTYVILLTPMLLLPNEPDDALLLYLVNTIVPLRAVAFYGKAASVKTSSDSAQP